MKIGTLIKQNWTFIKHKFVKVLSGKARWQLTTLFLFILIIFLVLLFICLCHYGCHKPKKYWDFFKGFLSLFIDPGSVWNFDCGTGKINGSGTGNSEFPNFGSLVVSMIGMFLFIGLLVSWFTNLLERKVERFRNGRMEFYHHDHVVIIGFSDVVPMLVKQLRKDRYTKADIVIQSAVDANEVRHKVFAELDDKEEKNVYFLNAKRDSSEELEKLHIHEAKEVFIIGDSGETYHDPLNMDCLDKIVGILKKKKEKGYAIKRIPFNVFFNNQNTFAAFQTTDLKKDWKELVDFRAYNFYDEWARRVLLTHEWTKDGCCIDYPSLDHTPIRQQSTSHVHLVIVGMNNMGTSLGVMASHQMHFPNFFDQHGVEQPQHSTVITFIDDHAEEEMRYFRGHYSGYFDIKSCTFRDLLHGDGQTQVIASATGREADFLDVRYEFIQGRIESDSVRQLIREWSERDDESLTIAICLSDSAKSLAAGLYLPECVYSRGIPILIRQESTSALIEQLRGDEQAEDKGYRKYRKVRPFGMLDHWFDLNDDSLNEAKMLHCLYDYFGKSQSLPTEKELEKEKEQRWKNLSISLKWSNMYAAYSIDRKLRGLDKDKTNFLIEESEIELIARMEHARWNMEKLLMGYRMPTDEEMEDMRQSGDSSEYKERFIHPCIASYNNLPEDIKVYDLNIARSLPTIVNLIEKARG